MCGSLCEPPPQLPDPRRAGRDADDDGRTRGGGGGGGGRRPGDGHPDRHTQHQLPERVRSCRAAPGGDGAAAHEAGGVPRGHAQREAERVGACLRVEWGGGPASTHDGLWTAQGYDDDYLRSVLDAVKTKQRRRQALLRCAGLPGAAQRGGGERPGIALMCARAPAAPSPAICARTLCSARCCTCRTTVSSTLRVSGRMRLWLQLRGIARALTGAATALARRRDHVLESDGAVCRGVAGAGEERGRGGRGRGRSMGRSLAQQPPLHVAPWPTGGRLPARLANHAPWHTPTRAAADWPGSDPSVPRRTSRVRGPERARDDFRTGDTRSEQGAGAFAPMSIRPSAWGRAKGRRPCRAVERCGRRLLARSGAPRAPDARPGPPESGFVLQSGGRRDSRRGGRVLDDMARSSKLTQLPHRNGHARLAHSCTCGV